MEPLTPRGLSGRPVGELTTERVCDGDLVLDDIRIHPDTLMRQAERAEEFGNPQLAESLRRAAEMTGLGDDELMAIYEVLRPGRSTAAELRALAEQLADRELPRCAALVHEACEVYVRRHLTT